MTVSQLSGKLKNAPKDTSLVFGSASGGLNREETLSVSYRVLPDNIGEENQLRSNNTEEQNLRVSVYVLNLRGKPLMPTTPRKTGLLLRKGMAKVVTRAPFTIQLQYATGETKQSITLGIDEVIQILASLQSQNNKN